MAAFVMEIGNGNEGMAMVIGSWQLWLLGPDNAATIYRVLHFYQVQKMNQMGPGSDAIY